MRANALGLVVLDVLIATYFKWKGSKSERVPTGSKGREIRKHDAGAVPPYSAEDAQLSKLPLGGYK